MLRKMLLMSPEYFERLRRHDYDVDMEAHETQHAQSVEEKEKCTSL